MYSRKENANPAFPFFHNAETKASAGKLMQMAAKRQRHDYTEISFILIHNNNILISSQTPCVLEKPVAASLGL